jgi:hypothetical protein
MIHNFFEEQGLSQKTFLSVLDSSAKAKSKEWHKCAKQFSKNP